METKRAGSRLRWRTDLPAVAGGLLLCALGTVWVADLADDLAEGWARGHAAVPTLAALAPAQRAAPDEAHDAAAVPDQPDGRPPVVFAVPIGDPSASPAGVFGARLDAPPAPRGGSGTGQHQAGQHQAGQHQVVAALAPEGAPWGLAVADVAAVALPGTAWPWLAFPLGLGAPLLAVAVLLAVRARHRSGEHGGAGASSAAALAGGAGDAGGPQAPQDDFLSTVSHELRMPLGCIKGYATTLLLPGGLQDERIARRCLEVIAAASDELQELVDSLMDATKSAAGTLDVDRAPMRLRPLALETVEHVRPRAAGHHLDVAVRADLPAVHADRHRVEQVLYNLLDNAIKYSPEGGRITITAHVEGEAVCVGVADEGLGIPEVLIDDLFERFHREATARTRGISGAGLGLAICKGIVEAHGGRIWATSPAPGRRDGVRPGALVRFTLPLAGASASAGALPVPAARSDQSRRGGGAG